MWRWMVLAYCVIVATLAFRAYPEIWHFEKLRITPYSMTSPSTVYDLAAQPSESTFVYRGNVSRQGTATEDLPSQLREKWNFQVLNVGIHGASKSSPAVDESGVYIGTDSGYFYALTHQGQLRWQVYLADSLKGIHGTAALDQDTAYIGGYNGILYALNKSNGSLRWSKKLGDAIGASPVLHEGALYISVETDHTNGFVAKVSARDGELIWVSRFLGEQSHSSPTLSPEKGIVIAGSNRAEVRAFSMVDGQQLWSYQLLGEMKSTANIVGDLVFLTSWGKRLQAHRIADGHLEWSLELKNISQSSPTYLQEADLIVASDHSGYLVAVDRLTGKVRWERQFAGFQRYLSSGLATPTDLWMLCAPQELCALDPSTGRTRAQIPLRATLSSVPTVFGKQLFLAFDGITGGLSAFSGDAK